MNMGLTGKSNVKSSLSAKVIRKTGEVIDRGVVSEKMITSVFANLIVDALQGQTVGIGTFKYHDTGTGVLAENVADTALQTPTGLAKATGTQVEGEAANIYKSVATITYDANYSITEHGIFNNDNVLMDRSVFEAEMVKSGDKIEWTYLFTFNAGG